MPVYCQPSWHFCVVSRHWHCWFIHILLPNLLFIPQPLPLLLFLPWQCLQGSKKENFGTEKWGTGEEEDLFFNLWVLATLFHNVPPDSWDSQFEKHWRMTFLLPLFLCRKRMKLWQSRNSRTVKVYIYFFFLYLVFVNRIWKRWNLAD